MFNAETHVTFHCLARLNVQVTVYPLIPPVDESHGNGHTCLIYTRKDNYKAIGLDQIQMVPSLGLSSRQIFPQMLK